MSRCGGEEDKRSLAGRLGEAGQAITDRYHAPYGIGLDQSELVIMKLKTQSICYYCTKQTFEVNHCLSVCQNEALFVPDIFVNKRMP